MVYASESKDDRKAQVVRGAYDALKEGGVGKLSFDLIAKHTGMSRQLVRYHFPDPDDLMIAVCDFLAQFYSEALISAASSLTGPKRISVFLDFYFDLLEGTPKPRDDQVYDALMALSAQSQPVRNALANQYGLLGQVLTHEFQLEYPELNRQSASEISFLFVSLMYGHWKLVATLGYAEHHNKITRQAMDRLIASYLCTPTDGVDSAKVWDRR